VYIREGDFYGFLSLKDAEPVGVPNVLRDLDVTRLHSVVFDKILRPTNVIFEMDHRRALEMVHNGTGEAAFFLNPLNIEDVKKVALAHERMPPKATYFYPKLLTGMVMYLLDRNSLDY
ncbi:MAG: DUF1015 family protein, partial [Nitrospirae bacterium]